MGVVWVWFGCGAGVVLVWCGWGVGVVVVWVWCECGACSELTILRHLHVMK